MLAAKRKAGLAELSQGLPPATANPFPNPHPNPYPNPNPNPHPNPNPNPNPNTDPNPNPNPDPNPNPNPNPNKACPPPRAPRWPRSGSTPSGRGGRARRSTTRLGLG